MARGIIFKNNGINELSNSPSGYKYLGYDGESLSEKSGATVSAIGGSSPYTTYKATILASSGVITATVFENTTGSTVTFTRTTTGIWTLINEFGNNPSKFYSSRRL